MKWELDRLSEQMSQGPLILAQVEMGGAEASVNREGLEGRWREDGILG